MDVVEGYKETKIGRIPSDWNLISFENLGDYYGGLNGKKKEDFGEGKPYIPFMNIMANDVIDTNYTDLVKIKEGEKQNLAHKGDLFFNTSSETPEEVGMCSVLNEQIDDLYLNSFCFGFRLSEQNKRIYLPEYISRFMRSGFGRKIMFPLAQGMTRYNLSKKYFLKLLIPFPPLKEQQKIVEILSTVDEQISTTQAIIDKSKELKKGLMQKLFSEGIGHTEFKDTKIGRIPKDWEVKKVGDICKLQGGFAFKSADATDSGVRWFKIANVGINRVKWDDESFLPDGFDEKHSDFILNEGDIVVAMTRPVLGGKLKICRILKNDSDSLLNQRVGRVLLKDKNDSIYFYQCFNTKQFIDSVEGELFGTDPPNISSKLFENIKIPVPSKPERVKIAEILSEADSKIEKEEQEKTKLEELKKGLMQQLLTGKKRVKV